jgi:MOSC domain-containing protein YiiM
MPSIHSIVYKPASAERQKSEDAYVRVPAEQVTLVKGRGIDGDLKGSNPKRQLNVMCYETLQGLGNEGFTVQPGKMGEQLIISGLDLIDLEPGTRVQIGADAQIEVIEKRNGCERFEHIQGKSPSLAQRRLGVMAGVVQGGVIRVGDSVTVI